MARLTRLPSAKSLSFLRRYQLGKVLGSGSYATVHEAVHRRTGELVAVKVTMRSELSNRKLV